MTGDSELTQQERDYLLNVIMQRPIAEALPLFLKMTGQKLAPANGSALPAPPVVP